MIEMDHDISNDRNGSCNDSKEKELNLGISCDSEKELNRVPSEENATYELGPFRRPSMKPIEEKKLNCQT